MLLAVTAALTLCDQSAKYLAVRNLTDLFTRADTHTLGARLSVFYSERYIVHLATAPAVVIPGVWQHRYTENPGAAGGLLADTSESFRRFFFGVVTLLAGTFVGVVLRRTPPGALAVPAALGGIMAGALGNLTDRLTRSYVIDFIDWRFSTFNLADACITVGVATFLVLAGRNRRVAEDEDGA